MFHALLSLPDLVPEQLQVLLHVLGGARPPRDLQEHQSGRLASLRRPAKPAVLVRRGRVHESQAAARQGLHRQLNVLNRTGA